MKGGADMKLFKGKLTVRAIVSVFSLLIVALVFAAQSAFAALLPNTTYTLELAKMNSNGTTTPVSTSNTVSDAKGKITFAFSNVPTQATTNFLIVTVKDAAGKVVIKSFAPAPAKGDTNNLGVNLTTTAQANLMEKLGTVIGTDDPVVMSFGLMFTRDPKLSKTDIGNLAIIAQQVIINGVEHYMTTHGATTLKMTTFKKKLVYNAKVGTTDLRAFTTLTKSAANTPASAKADMAKASGLIAAVFVDAAHAAKIDLDLIVAAFESADPNENTTAKAAMNKLSASFEISMNQSVNNFFTQLASVKVKQLYSDTLTELGASKGQKKQFNGAVNKLTSDMAAADVLFASYYDDTAGYDMSEPLSAAFAAGRLSNTGVIKTGITAGLPKGLATNSTVQAAMEYVYTQAFITFRGTTPGTGIQSTNADISAMKQGVAKGVHLNVSQLPPLGQDRDFDGHTVNWPIPQTASVDFVANALKAGGKMTYKRTTLKVPANMSWLNNNGKRNTFSGVPDSSFKALLGMQEDIRIADFTRYDIFSNDAHPARAAQQAVKQAFITHLATIVGNIGGRTDGTTAFTPAQKKALVQAQEQPNLD